MRTAPHSLPVTAGADLSATLLRLRAVGVDVARRRIYGVMHQGREAAAARHQRWSSMRRTAHCRTALVWVALALAFAVGYGYWTETVSVSQNVASTLRAR